MRLIQTLIPCVIAALAISPAHGWEQGIELAYDHLDDLEVDQPGREPIEDSGSGVLLSYTTQFQRNNFFRIEAYDVDFRMPSISEDADDNGAKAKTEFQELRARLGRTHGESRRHAGPYAVLTHHRVRQPGPGDAAYRHTTNEIGLGSRFGGWFDHSGDWRWNLLTEYRWLLSGRASTTLPDEATLRPRIPGGDAWTVSIRVSRHFDGPFHLIFTEVYREERSLDRSDQVERGDSVWASPQTDLTRTGIRLGIGF